ncbi:MAG: hypothetical protein FGM28_00055 [Limnohabitans sp.]|jgi:alpha-beta hydrolase superfamily lysophospholipase|nr:hypothetical protein [Limnohabitans sp.]
MPSDDALYYLTGMGGTLANGLGQALRARGLTVYGRELVGEFRACGFATQVESVVQDLQAHFWDRQARVLANSFGAYLFLHAQAQLPPFPGRVLLLSPIVGAFDNTQGNMHFVPPRAEHLARLAHAGHFPCPREVQVHVGEHDWQSQPEQVRAFGERVGIPVHIVPDAGHQLPHDYVARLLDGWLGA